MSDSQLLKGVLPMLVIAALTEAESYGYQLVDRLRAAGLAELTTGTVYPVLNRLEREGRISSRLVPSPSGPARKYYRPTDDGADALRQAAASWSALDHTVRDLLAAADSPKEPA
ncbi:PadR family transcriptional regulator [Cellulomonas taurus]|jgi:PadR family transcriptional regulator, regulatory protein PadR|uniref:PadR family transcriptional regulator n=1 Tax=Cellulomonas taurus TaxID=2729175 RepID=UPI00145F3437|nr:PadR family transcriptional regulator [Cellulomonas taurus]